MPYIECHIATGLSQPRKAKLIRDIVKVTHESIGSDPKIINVILHEHPNTTWPSRGEFTVKRRHSAVRAVPLFLSRCSRWELRFGLHVGGQRLDQLNAADPSRSLG